MPDLVGPLVDELSRRIRDTGNTGTSREVIRRLLAHAENLLGVAGAHVETFTLTTKRRQLVHNTADISDGGRLGKILTAQVDGRDIPPAHFMDYATMSPTWFRDMGPQPIAWTQLGRDYFLHYPGNPEVLTFSLIATAAPQAPDETYVGSDASFTTLDIRWSPILLDLTEVFLLLRLRRLDALEAPMTRLQALRQTGVL